MPRLQPQTQEESSFNYQVSETRPNNKGIKLDIALEINHLDPKTAIQKLETLAAMLKLQYGVETQPNLSFKAPAPALFVVPSTPESASQSSPEANSASWTATGWEDDPESSEWTDEYPDS